ncbi:MAG: AI-2E family transporter [Bryobacteraceae bacterium]
MYTPGKPQRLLLDMPVIPVAHEVLRTLGGYVKGQLKVAFILGLLYSIGYAIAGVPFWPLLGPFSGVLNLVPVVGGIIALLSAALATLLSNGSFRSYAGLLIVFIALQALEGFYLTPKLVGARVGLKPWAVFLAILMGGLLLGPLGLVIAVPLAATVAILWRRRKV